jgi:hypothetical protein
MGGWAEKVKRNQYTTFLKELMHPKLKPIVIAHRKAIYFQWIDARQPYEQPKKGLIVG